MYKFVTLILFIYTTIAATVLVDIPDGVMKCHRDDYNCFRDSAQEVVQNYPNGWREFNLLPYDPLLIKSLILPKNPSSAVNLELKFKDLEMVGLKTAHVIQAKDFSFANRSIFELEVPELILQGDYVIDGNILILPIKGNGLAVITCKNINLKYAFDLKPVTKDGQIYAQLQNVKLDLKPQLVQYQLNNLFNGDKALGDNMNEFLNENWRDIFNEMAGGFAKGISLVIKDLINTVLINYPYEILILDEDV